MQQDNTIITANTIKMFLRTHFAPYCAHVNITRCNVYETQPDSLICTIQIELLGIDFNSQLGEAAILDSLKTLIDTEHNIEYRISRIVRDDDRVQLRPSLRLIYNGYYKPARSVAMPTPTDIEDTPEESAIIYYEIYHLFLQHKTIPTKERHDLVTQYWANTKEDAATLMRALVNGGWEEEVSINDDEPMHRLNIDPVYVFHNCVGVACRDVPPKLGLRFNYEYIIISEVTLHTTPPAELIQEINGRIKEMSKNTLALSSGTPYEYKDR